MRGIEQWLAGLGARGIHTLLLVVSLLLFLPGFASLPVLDRDEARFAQASRQMLASGDFIDIRFQDEPRYKKPVGIYWLQSAAVALTGPEAAPIWKYRQPSLLAAVVSVLLTARIAMVFGTARAGLIAGLMMAGVFSLGMEARLAKTDAVLLLSILAAQAVLAQLWQAARAQDFTRPRLPLGAVLMFWAAISAGLLIKGPVGPMVSGLAVVALALIARRLRWLMALRPGLGLALTAVLVLPWYIAISVQSQGAFWAASLGHDMIGKLAGAQESHGAPPGTYLVLLWLTFFPASVGLALALRPLWRQRRSAAMLFVLAWVVPGWLVFELTPTKLTHYVLPFYPALAVAVALVWDDLIAAPRRLWHWLVLGALALLAATVLGAIGAYATRLAPDFTAPLGPLVLALLVLAVGIALTARAMAGHLPLLAATGLAVMGFGFSTGAVLAVSRVPAIWPAPRIVAAAMDATCPAPTIYAQGYFEPSLVFLSPGPVRPITAAEAAAHLPEPCARILLPAADKTLASVGREIARIEGLNLGSGKPVDLRLWKAR
ncbi:MAG: glycosyltransferase family 39 protein [Paracoccaceae bacterium]|nr:glycosyltransferase family 39 protein [Paracoccaceae bacterium]